MAAGHTSGLLTIFIIVVLFDCKTYSIRTYSVPKDFYSKDIHGLNADGLSFGLISREYILPVVRVVIRRHNLQSHFAVSLVLIKQSKHGTTCIALPSRLFVIDLTVHVDISPNPGPDVQLKPEYGKSNDQHLPCVINTLHSIQYSSGWLVHSSLPYTSDMFLRNFNQLQMSDVTWRIGQTNSTRRHQINTRQSALNINEHLTSGRQYPIETRITTRSWSTRSYYKRSESENLIEIACTPMVPSFKPSQATHFCPLNTRLLKNKTTLVHDYVVDRKVDILALAETWLAPGNANDLEINETTPNGYAFYMPQDALVVGELL